jgi:hypothetical protein
VHITTGHNVPFRVNAGYFSRALSSNAIGEKSKQKIQKEVINFPVPNRSLFKVITVVDGVEVNNKDAVTVNKLT